MLSRTEVKARKMDEMKLTGVEKTMLIPLWGRYSETKKWDGLIHDTKCIEIVEANRIDFTEIEKEQHPANRIAWFARAWNVDNEVKQLLHDTSNATIINLGCGLDTTYYRLNLDTITWYDIDLKNVIDIRQEIFSPNEHIQLISGSILDDELYSEIESSGVTIVIAVGLLYYFSNEQVKSIFARLQNLKKDKLYVH